MSLPEGAKIVEIIDENGNKTGKYYIRVDKGGISWVFTSAMSIEEVNAHYKIEEPPTTILQTEISLADEFIESDTLVDAGEIDLASEDYVSFLNKINDIKKNESWWANPNFVERYIGHIEGATDPETGKFDGSDFLTRLKDDDQIDDLLGEATRAEFNRAQDRRRDGKQFELDLETEINALKQTAKSMGVSDEDLTNSPKLLNAIKLIALNKNNGKYGDPTTAAAKAKVVQQLTALVDPFNKAYTLDGDIDAASKDMNFTGITTKQEEIQSLVEDWLPQHLWLTSEEKAENAGKLRNDPNYKEEFVEFLKDKKYAEYSMYDRNIKMSTIIGSKKSTIKNVWGIDVKGGSPVLHEIIKMNDLSKETEYLRGKGMELGIDKVKNDFALAQAGAYGEGIIKTDSFLER